MNIQAIDLRRVPAQNPRRSKSVRPRFKDANADSAFASSAVLMPPAVGGETLNGPDHDASLPAAYASEDHPLALLVRLRFEAARHVEALLAFLDATEGDPDLFDDSEPTLEVIRAAARLYDEVSDDHEDGADDEPWLGSPEIPLSFEEWSEKYRMFFERRGDQSHWAAGSGDDREFEPEHDESTGDEENSLGSTASNNQNRWSQGYGMELEAEHDGREPDE